MSDPELAAIVEGVTGAIRELVRGELAVRDARLAALEARPAPRDGRDGVPGPPGRDGSHGPEGPAGLGLDAFEALYDGERTLTHRYQSGERVKEFSFTLPIPLYRGVWQRTATYARGDCVTCGGSLWHANEAPPPLAKPGDGSSAWTLSVKRGQDGKDR